MSIRTISTSSNHSKETVPILSRAPGEHLPHTQLAQETSKDIISKSSVEYGVDDQLPHSQRSAG
jgi:hypothetical protein